MAARFKRLTGTTKKKGPIPDPKIRDNECSSKRARMWLLERRNDSDLPSENGHLKLVTVRILTFLCL